MSEISPVDIDPAIEWDKNTIRIKPTLLNPRDSITLSVVSSGGQPTFSARARIIGISAIEVAKTDTKAASPWKRWLLLIAAVACAVPAMAAWRRIDIFALDKPTISLRLRTIYLIVLVLVFAAMGAFMAFLSTYGIDDFWPVWLSTMLMLMVASFIGGRFDAIPEQKNDDKAKP